MKDGNIETVLNLIYDCNYILKNTGFIKKKNNNKKHKKQQQKNKTKKQQQKNNKQTKTTQTKLPNTSV